PVIQAICAEYGQPMVSTSANVTSEPPAMSCLEVELVFEGRVPCVVGNLGGLEKPTQIREATTGRVLR
ncbi:MAG: tRNA threonylcarbamoyladenosine biosynthesis protein RimN, partial [Thiomicrorhabdus sp.]|nr:tRNA threonylcarbamoyladenosine biosynthesis protein RimN [Thiomicrorhabdus sp.]